jgi:hypothetical protein
MYRNVLGRYEATIDVLQHKVIDMVKQIEDQSDIVNKFQSTVSAYSNLHA